MSQNNYIMSETKQIKENKNSLDGHFIRLETYFIYKKSLFDIFQPLSVFGHNRSTLIKIIINIDRRENNKDGHVYWFEDNFRLSR